MRNETPKQVRKFQLGYVVLSIVVVTVVLLPTFVSHSSNNIPITVATASLNEPVSDSTVGKPDLPQRAQSSTERPHTNHLAQPSSGSLSQANKPEQVVATDAYYGRAAAHRARRTVELNKADSADLVQLYNIGPTFARRIVAYRKRLGGFVDKRQLLEVYGMTAERYKDLERQLTLDTSLIKKININETDIAGLRAHPYIDYYQAKAIVDYRQAGNTITQSSDLLNVSLLDDSLVKAITPYINFQLSTK